MAKKEMEQKIAGIPLATITELDRIAGEYSLDKIIDGKHFANALKMAEGMELLKRLLNDDVMKSINLLQGSRLGFRTDKQAGEKYPPMVVRDCLIEAVIRGARPIGNEFNIISSGAYFTREYFERAVKELDGLTDLDIQTKLKASEVREGTTVDVGFDATWKLEGRPQTLSGTIPIRVNKRMGADAILGKMWRKVLARIHKKVTGSEHTLPEGDVEDCDIPTADAADASVLTPGRHKVSGKRDAVDTEAKPAFKVTASMIYDVEQAALASEWTMEQMHEWVQDRYGCALKDLKSETAYAEIVGHMNTETPDGKPVA